MCYEWSAKSLLVVLELSAKSLFFTDRNLVCVCVYNSASSFPYPNPPYKNPKQDDIHALLKL